MACCFPDGFQEVEEAGGEGLAGGWGGGRGGLAVGDGGGGGDPGFFGEVRG